MPSDQKYINVPIMCELAIFNTAQKPCIRSFSNNFKIFIVKSLSIKKLYLSLQPILDKNQKDYK